MAISFTPTKIARFVGALYGVALNNSTYTAATTEIYARGFDAVANEVFATDFGTKTTAQVGATIAANLGLTGAAATEATAYVEGQLNAAAANARGAVVMNILNLFAGLTGDVTYGAAATAFEGRVANAIIYSGAATSVYHGAFTDLSAGIVFNLTTGFDNLVGTSSADTFNAYEQNVDTLGTGDIIDGKGGDDVLFADIHTNIHGGIAPRTTSVEKAIFRVQHGQADSGDNNIAGVGIIDAERMVGTNIYEDNNSRADLVIEDVRIGASQKTKDITIIMRDTDPGNVDYAVYFDQNSLRNVSSANSSITLRVLDTYAVAQGLAELKDSPYGSFTFYYSSDAGVTYTKTELASQAMQDAQSITDMVAALQVQADVVFGAGVVTVAKGGAYSVPDSVTGNQVGSNEIILSTNAAIQFDTTRAGSGWKATDTVPAISGLYTSYDDLSVSSTDLVTSTVILDHVGRGSNGGDLIIGGLSVGTTSASRGVQQFDITVEDSSKLSNINSTNNTLQVVNIRNDKTDVQSDAYVTRTANAGDLFVGVNNTQANDLPGDDAQDNAYGFSDVRVINAEGMTGKLNFTSEFTTAAIAKYVNLVDIGALPSTDNIAVKYDGGTNDDSMDVSISGQAAASASNIVSGREDFTFTVNGNNGNDTITVRVENEAGGLADWYYNQNLNDNIAINGGAGDDTIRTPGAGDINIDAGAGADTLYTDNTGAQAAGALSIDVVDKGAWLFNTAGQTSAVAAAAAFRDLDDLRSDVNDSYNLYKAALQVTFKGIPSAPITLANTATYKTTDLEINQAIKKAINDDATLKKLLVAQDGPANSLIVKSLIDGVMTTGDLVVTLTAPTSPANDLTATELTAVNTAWGTTYATSAAALAAEATIVTGFNTKADYVDVLATDGTVTERTGAASTSTSDNFVTPGTGNDIIVLGTTVGADVGTSSNEVVKYTAADFGNDVIVNFAATGNGIDHLDFNTILGGAAGALTAGESVATNRTITVVGETTANDTDAEIQALYNAIDSTTTAGKHIYIAYTGHNVGNVYYVADGVADNDVTVTKYGSIDLADTGWATLSLTNFSTPTVYAEGPASTSGGGAGGGGAGGGGAGGLNAITVTAAGVAGTAAADSFNADIVTALADAGGTNFQPTITGFTTANDVLVLDMAAANAATTLAALNGQNGVSVQYDAFADATLINFGNDANGGQVVSITLAGVADASLVTVQVV